MFPPVLSPATKRRATSPCSASHGSSGASGADPAAQLEMAQRSAAQASSGCSGARRKSTETATARDAETSALRKREWVAEKAEWTEKAPPWK
nr:unnamed protein product [Digitaria exilis]